MEQAALTGWQFTQGDHKGLLCQWRTKCCQCSLMKSKKERVVWATLSLGYICLFSLGSCVGRWQKSQKDMPQFLRPTLNAQSLNFSWSIDSWCEGMSQWCNWRNVNLALLNSWGCVWKDLRIAGAGSELRKGLPVLLQEVISLFRVYFLPTCLSWIGCCIWSLWIPFSHAQDANTSLQSA